LRPSGQPNRWRDAAKADLLQRLRHPSGNGSGIAAAQAKAQDLLDQIHKGCEV